MSHVNWGLVIQNGLLGIICVILFWIFVVLVRFHMDFQDHADWDRDEWEKMHGDKSDEPGQDRAAGEALPVHPGSDSDDPRN